MSQGGYGKRSHSSHMHLDTYKAARGLAESILTYGEADEVNQYGEIVHHLADLLEDYEVEEGLKK